MSGEIGLNSDLRVGKQKLHIQTSFEDESQRVLVQVFDGGQLLDQRESLLKENLASDQIREKVSHFHGLVTSDIQLLLVAATKVKNSQDVASLKKVGLLCLEKGFYDQAIGLLQTAQKMEPQNGCCLLEIGRAFFKKGDYEKAAKCLLSAIVKNPKYPDLNYLLAQTYWKDEKYEQAIFQLEKAVSINPDYHQAYYELGLYLLESTIVAPKSNGLLPPIERIKQAAENLKKAFNLSDVYDKNLAEAGFSKLDDRTKVDSALDDFKKSCAKKTTQLSHSVVDSEFYLKFLFAGLDKDSDALDYYIDTINHTLTQHSKYADLHQGLGVAYLIKAWHYFAKAIEEFKRAVKINPDYARANKNLKLAENEGRGFLILLRAILKQD